MLYSVTRGGGRPVVMLHGFATSHKYWDRVISRMPRNNFEIHTPDMLGFGQSSKPNDSSYTVDDHVEAIISSIFTGIDKPTLLVGHSMGAMVATRIARLHPELVSGLVLINMPSLYNEEQSDREILRELPLPQRAYVSPLGKMLHTTRESKIAKAVPRILYPKNQDMQDIITDSLTHTRTSLIRSLRNTILKYEPLEDMREIDIETMYIYSTEDRYFSRPVLETILTLPDVKTIELAGGHQLPIRQAEAIARIIRSGL